MIHMMWELFNSICLSSNIVTFINFKILMAIESKHIKISKITFIPDKKLTSRKALLGKTK